MTENENKADFGQLLDQAQLPEDAVDICLRGDMVAQYHALQQQMAAIPAPLLGAESLGGNPAKVVLQEQMDAVGQQMRLATVTFRLRALSKRACSEFLADHPPRADDRRDMVAGYNRETMGTALVRACMVDPKPTPAQWEKLCEVLSVGEFAKLELAARDLNFAEVNVPFLQAASPSPQSSASE